jgi:hypothetical protein
VEKHVTISLEVSEIDSLDIVNLKGLPLYQPLPSVGRMVISRVNPCFNVSLSSTNPTSPQVEIVTT